MNKLTRTQNETQTNRRRQEALPFLLRIKPGKQNPPPQPVRQSAVRLLRFPADDSALSATAQTLDYLVASLIYS